MPFLWMEFFYNDQVGVFNKGSETYGWGIDVQVKYVSTIDMKPKYHM